MANGAEGSTGADRVSRGSLLGSLLRPLGILTLTLIIYSLVPIEGPQVAGLALVGVGIGVLVILAVFARQVSRVANSDHPVRAAVEALVLVFGLFVCLFALAYVALCEVDPTSFSKDITKVAGIYFTVTILTTVGFGDITAATETAQIVVTLQMLIGLFLIGTAVKVLTRSARTAAETHNPHVAALLGSDGGAGHLDDPSGPSTSE